MRVHYVKVIFFCFNIKYSMVFIEYMFDESVIHYAQHRTEHASFLTNISQGSVATRLRCGGIANEHLYSPKAEIQVMQYNIKYNTI